MDKDTLALWQKRHTFTLGEAALLILGLSPDEFVIGEMLNNPTPERFKAIFWLMVADAKEELRVSESQEYEGQYFTEYRLMTNNSQDDIQTRNENEWLMTEVSYGAIREWTELRGCSRVFDDDYVIQDKPFSLKEQNANMTKELSILIEASDKFWKNADKKLTDTHSNNAKEVVPWLMESGFSESLAKAGASIIRPIWAHKGRSPEK